MNFKNFSLTVITWVRNEAFRKILNGLIVCLTLLLSTVMCVAQQKPLVLAEGTPLYVVTAQEISSKTAIPGNAVNFKS